MAVGPVFGRTCAMSGKAVWNENLGSALMTGEFVRFNKNFLEEGKNHCGQIVDVMQFGSLPAAEKRKYGSDDERCRTANFIKVRWAAIVGDTDGIVRDTCGAGTDGLTAIRGPCCDITLMSQARADSSRELWT